MYSKADRLIVWLGPDENGDDQAFKAFETVLGNTIRYPNTFDWGRGIPKLLTMNKTFTTDDGMSFESNDMLEKMVLFLNRTFWTRLWIVQEMGLPSKLTHLCGDEFTDMPETDSVTKSVRKLIVVPTYGSKSVSLNIHEVERMFFQAPLGSRA